jgi:hypothetical protein
MGGVPFWGDQPTMRQAIRVARGHFEIFDYGDGVPHRRWLDLAAPR